jgi:hypothetical protein
MEGRGQGLLHCSFWINERLGDQEELGRKVPNALSWAEGQTQKD